MSRDVSLTDLPVLRRMNRYVTGQLLTVEDLQVEQEYHRARARLHNRLLHGHGVVAGLEVRSSKGRILVSPGVAIDALGNDIVLVEERCVELTPATGKPGAKFVVVRYAEALAGPLPVAGGDATDVRTHFRHVIEGAELSVVDAVPKAPDVTVVLARVLWRTTQWRVDVRYRRRSVR
ncbi:MAG TPA: hypothetical protein VE861_10920 [Gemmatimonadaceae bacterium]|nr:hypothetical protein [Gemmatimonadaceae bacterium]